MLKFSKGSTELEKQFSSYIYSKFRNECNYYIEALDLSNADITISCSKINKDTNGLCQFYNRSKNTSESFIIIINQSLIDQKANDLISEVLAHEFVHVEQYTLGKLIPTDKGQFWNGKLYFAENELEEYYLPWEFEARLKSRVLNDGYTRLRKLMKTFDQGRVS